MALNKLVHFLKKQDARAKDAFPDKRLQKTAKAVRHMKNDLLSARNDIVHQEAIRAIDKAETVKDMLPYAYHGPKLAYGEGHDMRVHGEGQSYPYRKE